MGDSIDHWAAIATGVLISTISAILIWALRKLANIHPPANGKAAEKIREQIRQELAEADELRTVHKAIRAIRDDCETMVTEMRHVKSSVRDIDIRVAKLEEA
jgi:hypothetical protein